MEKVYIENAKKHTDKVCPTFNKKIDLNISIGTHLESIFHRTNANPCILVFILQPSIEQPFQNKFTFQIIELAKFDVRT